MTARFYRNISLLIVLVWAALATSKAQVTNAASLPGQNAPTKRLNFYIFTKDASSKLDFFGKTALLRARTKSLFSKGQLYAINAQHTAQAVYRILAILAQENALVGSLWIDSHGLYKQGYSSFHIGNDEYSYKNINDSAHTALLQLLARYCDGNSHIGIGSCYGGATFYFPGSATVPPGRMNGDSLMLGMGRIFSRATIYGSESWVMAKPGIFSDNFGFAGYPLGKRYRSRYWQPVWERLGQWNRYQSSSGVFEPVNTVALNSLGQITVRARHYQLLDKGQKAVGKNMAKLE
jgi:hypothetical protein